jgi:hypothetical protein
MRSARFTNTNITVEHIYDATRAALTQEERASNLFVS